MFLFPHCLEFLKLLIELGFSVLKFIAFSELSYCFELEEDFLEVTAALSSSAVFKILLHKFKDSRRSK